ncbi:hypothetical protein E4U41_004451 [Claviceps citrina]|nr:hypothetical protein E4U41_004451 [Claviceps citrina]
MTAENLTHYTILGLTPSAIDASSPSSTLLLLKKAYRRALLRHHPDKQIPSSTSTSSPVGCTVDQISTAFAVLSSPARRAEYDASLRQSRRGGPLAAAAAAGSAKAEFQTGVENVDLDDLLFDEASERWYRSCRCGNGRGYLFGEDDLVEVEDEGVLLVGCQDCSLWLRVHFAVLNDSLDPEFKQRRKIDSS